MKKLTLCLALLVASMPLMSLYACEGGEGHSPVRYLESSEFNLMDVLASGALTGIFGEKSVWLAQSEKGGYEGWAMRGKAKLPIKIGYENKKLKADFNGTLFSFAEADAEKGFYVFNTPSGRVKVSLSWESKEGRHMKNILFTIPNNGRNYLVRLKGEACMGYGLYYAAVLYGLTTFDAGGVADVNKTTETTQGKKTEQTKK